MYLSTRKFDNWVPETIGKKTVDWPPPVVSSLHETLDTTHPREEAFDSFEGHGVIVLALYFDALSIIRIFVHQPSAHPGHLHAAYPVDKWTCSKYREKNGRQHTRAMNYCVPSRRYLKQRKSRDDDRTGARETKRDWSLNHLDQPIQTHLQ